MAKGSPVIQFRLPPVLHDRLDRLPSHPRDRSVSDLIRRVLEAGCEAIEREQNAGKQQRGSIQAQ